MSCDKPHVAPGTDWCRRQEEEEKKKRTRKRRHMKDRTGGQRRKASARTLTLTGPGARRGGAPQFFSTKDVMMKGSEGPLRCATYLPAQVRHRPATKDIKDNESKSPPGLSWVLLGGRRGVSDLGTFTPPPPTLPQCPTSTPSTPLITCGGVHSRPQA